MSSTIGDRPQLPERRQLAPDENCLTGNMEAEPKIFRQHVIVPVA
jgi:hypothetical protein